SPSARISPRGRVAGTDRSEATSCFCLDLWGGLGSSERGALELETVSVVEEAGAQGGTDGRIADGGGPGLCRELARREGGGAVTAGLDGLDQVASFGVPEGGEEPVIDGEELDPG